MLRNSDGATAIEFAILAIPFTLLTFAIFETFVAFAAEEVLANGVENLSRQIRTGQITFGQGKTTDLTEAEFRQAVCDQISVMITCSDTEAATPQRLYVDVRQYASFAAMPRAIPRVANSPTADLDTTGFAFAPGGAKTINMVRIYYRWQIMTDFMRPYITNIRPADGSLPTDYLIISTATIQNEDYK
jgi:Flp pilus assembly protein TadG